jgi:hypothetical protein
MEVKAMLKRDTFMPQQHWEDYTQTTRLSIQRFEDAISKSGISQTDVLRLRAAIFEYKLWLTIAEYSRGLDIHSLRGICLETISAFIAYQALQRYRIKFEIFEEYIYSIWILSLAILLELDNKNLVDFLEAVGNEGKDMLFEYMAAFYLPKRSDAKKILFPKPYQLLYQAVTDGKSEREVKINKFLRQYYQSMRKASWYNLHVIQPGNFFGYWCFELAALVKILHISDETFRDNIYYPKDLITRH